MASSDVKPASSPSLPELSLPDWQATYDTLHMWTQIVGKVRLEQCPDINHWWGIAFYVTASGLTTSPIPYGNRSFEIRFDFIDHKLLIETSGGDVSELKLEPQSVAEFYRKFMAAMRELGINVHIYTMPVEFPNPIPFEKDEVHASYDAEAVGRFWRILQWSDAVFKEFRAGFIGKASPVHFFWGSFDLAVTRFSGRPAPPRPGADPVTAEAYSHEVSSAGFWPGGNGVDGAAYYAYAAPQPPGFAEYKVKPGAAFYHPQLGEYLLMYDDVRRADSPKEFLVQFLQTTYDAAATLGKWDRKALERSVA
ncbi:MAG: DUF5996 family protein [Candidatus Korobacteraceae bacterium]